MFETMLMAMLLAHFIGDYWLQWDALALWKSRSTVGAVIHGLIVCLITLFTAILVDPSWWRWALLIGISHIIVDGGQQWWKTYKKGKPVLISPLTRFLLDQAVHLGVILWVLTVSGVWEMPAKIPTFHTFPPTQRWLLTCLGYVLVTLPAWIFIEFMVRGLIQGAPPNFKESTNKYVGSLERGLITTFVIMGQFLLIPIVALPRFLLDQPHMRNANQRTFYVAELLASVGLAVGTGLFLRQIW